MRMYVLVPSKCTTHDNMCHQILINFIFFASLLFTFSLAVGEDHGSDYETFDFVIAGGGTAGCTLARRLSDNEKFTVLLIERGPLPDPILDIPALASSNNDNYVKVYNNVRQRNAGLQNGGFVYFLAGRALGGGSSVNSMIFNRGSPHDFDRMANITGDMSWKYANMLQYFRRVEDYHGDFPSDVHHGVGGPITVSNPRYAPGLSTWLEAGKQLGFPVADPNGPQRISFAPFEYSKRFGRRVSCYEGYLRPIMHSRKNLKVVTGVVVSRVTFEGKRATGVTYKVNGTGSEFFVRARKEVIVSSGVIESPAILMRSGVGPKEILRKAGIPAVKYLPVGENLHDHVCVILPILVNKRHPVFNFWRDLTPENWRIFNETGEGPYSSYGGFHGQAFLTSSYHNAQVKQNPESTPADWADIHLLHFSTSEVIGFFNFRNDTPMTQWTTVIHNAAQLARPRSRGSVTLNLENIEGDPFVDFNYLSDPYDMKVLVEGIKSSLNVFENTEAYQSFDARLPSTPFAACAHLKFRSDAYWRCYIRQSTYSGLHGVGSCAMRGPNDPRAVVDSNLKVIGLQNLRIVDASIIPEIPTPNINAAVNAIAEKASEVILNYHA